jgi:hypothetical protein
MIKLEEKPWSFEFDDETPYWKWVLYADENIDFIKVKSTIKGTRSCDFIGIYLGNAVLLEVKYYADDAVLPNNTNEIINSLAQKVRDSLSCIVGGSRNSTNNKMLLNEWIEKGRKTENKLYAVFFIDFPKSWPPLKIKATKGIFLKTLKQKLNWLTGNVILIEFDNYKDFFQGLDVSRI